MVQEASRVKLTFQDLALLPDDERRHEIIDGDHFVTPSPSTRHQRILLHLAVALESYLKEGEVGKLFLAPCDVVFSDFDVVEPDLLVVTGAAEGVVTEANIQGAPGLVVEILSPSTESRDRGLKRKLYEKFGVQEYWIVDPAAEGVEILRLSSGRLMPAEPLSTSDSLSSPLLPGLEIPLSAIFEE